MLPFLSCSDKNDPLTNEDTRVVLVGERHDYIKKFDLQLSLIKSINQLDDIKAIVFEQPYTTGIVINEFFVTGDTLILQNFLKKEGTLLSKDFLPLYKFYKDLYDYRQSLNDEQKFSLHFIDIETLKVNNIVTWIELLGETDYAPLKYELDKIKLNSDQLTSTLNTINQLKAICQKESLLKNHKHREAIEKIYEGFNTENRDELMSQRIHELLDYYESGIIFGQFGDWHICRKSDSSLVNLMVADNAEFSHNQLKTIHLNFHEANKPPKFNEQDRREVCDYDIVIHVQSSKGVFLR
jgi:hypothetical protein